MPMSYEFVEFPVKDVRIRKRRQRKEFRKIEELAESISRNGLLHPIVLDRENFLVAGERRLKAHKELKRETIPVHYLDQLDSYEARAIELEENIKRLDLTWQESCLATADYHRLRCLADEEWNQVKTAEAIGLTKQHVSRLLQVADGLEEKDELVSKAESFEAARRVVSRRHKRAIDTELSKIDVSKAGSNIVQMAGVKPAEEPPSVLCMDFMEWIDAYDGKGQFNFIHCDFPYGVRMGKTTYGGSATWKKYGDDPEVFGALLDCLLTNQPKLFLKSAHFMFWFSMNYYTEVHQAFTEAGFRINPFPLVWAKNKGLIPDYRREGRRIYETAFFGSLGDRKVLTSTPNLIHSPVDKKTHLSEKPQPVLEHFFRMFVDKHSEVFDPTCGSGNALAVAKKLGAARVFGLDIEEEHVESANTLIKRTKVALPEAEEG